MQQVWDLTLASAAEHELPKTLVDRITTLLEDIAGVAKERQARRGRAAHPAGPTPA